MKILLSTISFDSLRGGGTTERTRKLSRYLKLAGHDVAVAAIENGAVAAELEELDIATYATGYFRFRFSVPTISPVRLWRMVQESDAVHILGYWNLLSVATAFLAHTASRPYVFSAAGEFSALDHPHVIARLFHYSLGKRMVRNAKAIIAITEHEKLEICQRFGRSDDKVVVIANGVDVGPSSLDADRVDLPIGRFALFVGRLAPIKGPDLLIEAFARVAEEFPDVSLVIAGPDFGMEADLGRLVAERSLVGRVVFTGFLDEGQRSVAMRRAALLVVPSRAEAMSLVAVEAGMQGLPVLLTDTCGLPELEETGGGAICTPTVEGLAEGLCTMLSSPNLAAQGERWREYVLANFQWSEMASRLTELLKRYV